MTQTPAHVQIQIVIIRFGPIETLEVEQISQVLFDLCYGFTEFSITTHGAFSSIRNTKLSDTIIRKIKREKPHQNLIYTQLLGANMVMQKSAYQWEINSKDGKHRICLHGVVNLRANAVFTTYLTLVFTFFNQICTE